MREYVAVFPKVPKNPVEQQGVIQEYTFFSPWHHVYTCARSALLLPHGRVRKTAP